MPMISTFIFLHDGCHASVFLLDNRFKLNQIGDLQCKLFFFLRLPSNANSGIDFATL
jgi:hypothetical protein